MVWTIKINNKLRLYVKLKNTEQIFNLQNDENAWFNKLKTLLETSELMILEYY